MSGCWRHRELDAEGRMTVRVYEQSQFTTLDGLKAFVEKGYNTGWGNHWFKIGPLKMLGDGSPGARSAYLSQPYIQMMAPPGESPFSPGSSLKTWVEYADSQGMQVAIHAIGDGILDDIPAAYEKALHGIQERTTGTALSTARLQGRTSLIRLQNCPSSIFPVHFPGL